MIRVGASESVSCYREVKIHRWRIEDGKEAGTPMHTESVLFFPTSQCLAESQKKATAPKSGAESETSRRMEREWTACVWSLSTGKRLLVPFKHDGYVITVKFDKPLTPGPAVTWSS